MAKWFYYNESGEKIEVTGTRLKELAKAGILTPETMVETSEGRTAYAKDVKGLTFSETSIQSVSSRSTCANCGLSISETADVCSVCGTASGFADAAPNDTATHEKPVQPPPVIEQSAPQNVFCQRCGENVSPEQIACLTCGTEIKDVATPFSTHVATDAGRTRTAKKVTNVSNESYLALLFLDVGFTRFISNILISTIWALAVMAAVVGTFYCFANGDLFVLPFISCSLIVIRLILETTVVFFRIETNTRESKEHLREIKELLAQK